MKDEILRAIREKGMLLDKDVFNLISSFGEAELVRDFLDEIEKSSGQKIITKGILNRNFQFVKDTIGKLGAENKEVVEKIIVNLGISFEVTKESRIVDKMPIDKNDYGKARYEIVCPNVGNYKKLEVGDFVGNFRARYQELQKILMSRAEIQNNLISIGKISMNERKSLSIIGIVSEKRVTKNGNLIVSFEDLTGKISALVKPERKEVFEKAEELQLDDVVAVKASGNRELIFIYDIFFPEAHVPERVEFDSDIAVAFISDIHCGSDRHLGAEFEKFLDFLNKNDEAGKIKYLFISGDNVDGVGIFPGQENLLKLKSMKEQYNLLSSYLKRIPKEITVFICPGQHDASRVAEPQPPIDKKYAPGLYNIENLVLVTNPALVKIYEGSKELKVLMSHGANMHALINEIKELREMNAHRCPARAVRHMLKRRHLGPTHSSVTYIPNADKDPLVISDVPDILCTGEVHRLDIDNYNGVLIITGSCWQSQTPFEEKVGNIPDPCKVPVLNLKTRKLKIYDFSKEEDGKIL
jgi:DNA polymerase II small subunit